MKAIITNALRRLRDLEKEPYTQKEAEAAAGLATDNGYLRGNRAGAHPTGLHEGSIATEHMEADN